MSPKLVTTLKQNKQPQNFRFTPETIRRLALAAHRAGMSKNTYVEQALKKAFQEEGL